MASLNTSHVPGSAGTAVILFKGEKLFFYYKGSVANFKTKYANELPKILQNRKSGRLFLTTHRLIFCNREANDPMMSFSIPICQMYNLIIFETQSKIEGRIKCNGFCGFNKAIRFSFQFPLGACKEFGDVLKAVYKNTERPEPPKIWNYLPEYYYQATSDDFIFPFNNSKYPFAEYHKALYFTAIFEIFIMDREPPYPGYKGWVKPDPSTISRDKKILMEPTSIIYGHPLEFNTEDKGKNILVVPERQKAKEIKENTDIASNLGQSGSKKSSPKDKNKSPPKAKGKSPPKTK